MASSTLLIFFLILLANKKLAEMNGELAKAQEHAKRFQDLLAAERRKQKTLQVNNNNDSIIVISYFSSMHWSKKCSTSQQLVERC